MDKIYEILKNSVAVGIRMGFMGILFFLFRRNEYNINGVQDFLIYGFSSYVIYFLISIIIFGLFGVIQLLFKIVFLK